MSLGIKRGHNFVKERIQSLKDRVRRWYDCEFYPRYGRIFVYNLSFDIKGIKESLGEKSIFEVLKHPRDFLKYFVPRRVIRWKNRYLREREKRKQYPEKLSSYRMRVAEFEKENRKLDSERDNFERLYFETEMSIEAMKTRLASGELEAEVCQRDKRISELEKTADRLKQDVESLSESEMELGRKYGEQLMRANSLEQELVSSKQSILKQHEQLEKAREADMQLEAVKENERRNYEKIVRDKDNLIGLLKKQSREREDIFMERYLKKILTFVDESANIPAILVNPNDEMAYFTRGAREILHLNGDAAEYIGRKYYELLDLDEGSKARVQEFFNNPRVQRAVLPIRDKKGKSIDMRISKLPLFGFFGEERRHLKSICIVTSVRWLESLVGKYKHEDLERKIALKRREKEERIRRQEETKQIIDEARKELDESMDNKTR